MAHKYCVRKKIDKNDGTERVRYYAVALSSGTVETSQLAEEIADRCSLSTGDVKATIVELLTTIEQKLTEGYKVRLDGIGLFSLSAESPGFETAEACTPPHVKAKRVCFKADPELKRALSKITFRK